MATLHGQIDASSSLEDLRGVLGSGGVRCSLRASSHHVGGAYLRLTTAGADMTFERVSGVELLVQADADDHAALRALAWTATRKLRQTDLRHRFELYGGGERIEAYFHHRWPSKRVWIGSLARSSSLAAGVADLARRAGAAAELQRFDRFPVADALAAMLASVGHSYDLALWILADDEGREDWVARESKLMARRDAIDVFVYRTTGTSVARSDAAALDVDHDSGRALALARDAFSWVDLGLRQLLVVDDSFLVRDHGLVLAPDIPLHVLPGSSQQRVAIAVATPQGRARRFDARVAIPLVNPPTPDREPAYVVTLPEASTHEVPAGSEIWLDGAAP